MRDVPRQDLGETRAAVGVVVGEGRKKREELLDQIQKILHERVVYAPIWENAFIRGVGPRVEEPGLALIPSFPYSGPFEEVRLKRP